MNQNQYQAVKVPVAPVGAHLLAHSSICHINSTDFNVSDTAFICLNLAEILMEQLMGTRNLLSQFPAGIHNGPDELQCPAGASLPPRPAHKVWCEE